VPARGIIDPFLDLPPKQYYPDYYDLIKSPICMKQIENKINRKQYHNLKQFRADIGLLCKNCRQYNEDGSVLYQDANLIEVCFFPSLFSSPSCPPLMSTATVPSSLEQPTNVPNQTQSACLEKLQKETSKFPRWQNFDEPESLADNSSLSAAPTTKNNSAAATPQPPARSGFKLKLGGPKTPATTSAAGTPSATAAKGASAAGSDED
jgi:ATP-dependent helicase STH1/SNF2